MLICIEQHLSNILSSIHHNGKQELKKKQCSCKKRSPKRLKEFTLGKNCRLATSKSIK